MTNHYPFNRPISSLKWMSRVSAAWESEDPCSLAEHRTVELLIVLGLLPALDFIRTKDHLRLAFTGCRILCAAPELSHPTLCPCLWDPVTMLTESPRPERLEPRPTLKPAVCSAAPCLSQPWHSSRLTAHTQAKCLSFSWNGLPCSLSWSSSPRSEETSWSFSLCRWRKSCRMLPTTF